MKNQQLFLGDIFLNLYVQGDRPWLIVTHGIGEHSLRHNYIYDLLHEHYNICFYDLRGHGKSKGKRAYIESFTLFYKDLNRVISYLRDHFHMKVYDLYGHSMGALITLQSVLLLEKSLPSKVFLSGTPLCVQGGLGSILFLFPKLTHLLTFLPTIKLSSLIDLAVLSHSPSIALDYKNDPFNCTSLHTHLIIEMINAANNVIKNEIKISCDYKVVFAGDDKIVNSTKSSSYFDKNHIVMIDNAFHEIHNEVDEYKKIYFKEISSFFLGFSYI